MNQLRKLAIVIVAMLVPMAVNADPILINVATATDSADNGLWEVTTAEGTVGELLSLLEQQVWWGDEELARIFAEAVGLSLGGPNRIGLPGDGPFFGFGTGETLDGMVGAYKAMTISEGGALQSIQCHYPEPCAYVSYTWATASRVDVPEPVTIDIKPGKTPNSINLKSKGRIPVAILTTESFDASQVDWDTVLFSGASKSHAMGHVKDVDGDGDLDLLLHFNTQETGIQCGDTEATLTGELFSAGGPITGTDSIRTVNCPVADNATITVLIGDKDCFGLGGECSDVSLFVIGQEGNRDPGDPLGTDQSGVNFELGGPSFDFGLDLGGATPLSASLTILTAGIGFEGTTGGSGIGATFYFNGTEIGYYFEAPGFQNLAATIVFDVPIFLLADLNNITVFHPDIGNDVAVIRKKFAIDYLELTVMTATTGP